MSGQVSPLILKTTVQHLPDGTVQKKGAAHILSATIMLPTAAAPKIYFLKIQNKCKAESNYVPRAPAPSTGVKELNAPKAPTPAKIAPPPMIPRARTEI